MFNKILLKKESTIKDALVMLNNEGLQIVLVIDNQRKLIGTISDGDIRRGLLDKKTLDSSVLEIMNSKFIYAKKNQGEIFALEIMKKNSINQLPILDDFGRVIDLFLLKDLINIPLEKKNAVVIMAGGEGKRLRPLTENCPKPMLEVGGKPMLQTILESLIESGFKKFFFSVNYLKERIIDYFGDGSKWNVEIQYLIEDKPLGTAGSLTLLPKNLSDPIIVMNGDILTKFDPKKLIEFHNENASYATICVRDNETIVPFGVIESNGIELTKIIEKPTYNNLVSAGVYTFDPEVIGILSEEKKIDIPDLILLLKKMDKRVLICPIHEYWLDIGRRETLTEAYESWIN